MMPWMRRALAATTACETTAGAISVDAFFLLTWAMLLCSLENKYLSYKGV
jgi:hypothetical protein